MRRGAERRLRRRRAARAHRLPQLRQPREARDRLGARAGDRRDLAGRGVARHPGRLRERLALQRDRRRPIPPTPVVGCVGLVRDVTRIPDRWQRGDRVAAAARLRSRARRASSGGTRTCCRSRTTSPTAASRSRCARPRRGRAAKRRLRRRRRRGRDRRGRARTPRSPGTTSSSSGRWPRCAASSASARRAATSRGSRTSASTRCSIAARSRRGSPSARTGG